MIHPRRILTQAVAATLLCLASVSDVSAWRTDVQGSVFYGLNDAALTVAVDEAGNPVVGGYITPFGQGQDFTVIKFDRTSGEELWRYTVDGGARLDDYVRAVAVDRSGDVFAAGGLATSASGRALVVVRLHRATGAELWRRMIDGGSASALVVDAAGNVIVVGGLGGATNADFAIVKLVGGTGAEMWRHTIDGPDSSSDWGMSVALDARGDVLAAGYLTEAHSSAFTVIKVDGVSGSERWRRTVRATTSLRADVAYGISATPSGDAIAVGILQNSERRNQLAAVRLDGATGAEQWRSAITGRGAEYRGTVAVDATGDAFVGGWSPGFTVVKLNGGTGVERWRAQIADLGLVSRLVVDATGNVVAAGSLPGAGTDFAVAKVNGTTGSVLWQVLRSGTQPDAFDLANDVVLTTDGDIVAAGQLGNRWSGLDFSVAMLRAATGTVVWQQDISLYYNASNDQANAVIFDPLGDVLATGYVSNDDGWRPLTVAKLGAKSGAELWRAELHGTRASGANMGTAIASDADGNALVAGTIVNERTNPDFAVSKLAAKTGAVLWRQEITGTAEGSSDHARGIVVDAASGDAIAVGTIRDARQTFTVVRLVANTGDILWRFDLNRSGLASDEGRAVALDSGGDVIAVGQARSEGLSSFDMAVVKLGGLDGEERWRTYINGQRPLGVDDALSVVIDANDDVIVAGFVELQNGRHFAVVKLSGKTGAELWRYVGDDGLPRTNRAMALAIDGAGDVVAGGVLGPTGQTFTVVKLDGRTGGSRWRTALMGPGGQEWVLAVAVDAWGDVIATGAFGPFQRTEFIVVKFDGSTGDEVWRRTFARRPEPRDEGRALVIDAAGDVIAAGVNRGQVGTDQFTVIKLYGVDGSDF